MTSIQKDIRKNELRAKNETFSRESEPDVTNIETKLRLKVLRNQQFTKKYHHLKRRKVKLEELKFTCKGEMKKEKATEEIQKKNNCVSENIVINWLLEQGIKIKQISATQYCFGNRLCLFNTVLVFANRKRVDMGLKPFKIEYFF